MIQKLYPYYGSPTCKEDWKPAVKFNLVHNKMFTKITSPATANGSKKRKWVVDEHYLSERQKLLSEEEQQTVPDTTTPSSENKIYNNLAHYKFGGPAAHSKRRSSSSSSSIRARRDSLSQNPDYIKFIKTLKAAHSKSLTKHKAAGTSNEMSPDVGPFIKLVLRTLRARHMDLERLLLKAYTFEDAEAQRQLLSVIKMVLRSTFGRDVASPPPSPGLNKPAVRKTAGVSQGPKLVQV